MQSFNLWQFIAGVSVFVYAMSLLETSVRNLAGRSFKKFLQRQSRSRVKMAAATTVTTAILQSSSIVILMVLSFVGAGLLGMRGALAAVLGSNLGTTLDSWIIAVFGFKFDFHAISYPLLGLALVGWLFFRKHQKIQHFSVLSTGLALIFIALQWLKSSMQISLDLLPHGFHELHYLAFIPVGLVITSLIQSSSATIAITLSALYNNLIPFENAAAIVIGSELGTTLKFLVGSAGGNADKKRVAWGNFFLNFCTMVIAASILEPLIYLIREVLAISDRMIGLVLFQTGINVVSIVLFFPFLGVFARQLERLFRSDRLVITKYIGQAEAPLPDDALDLARLEIERLAKQAAELNLRAMGVSDIKDFPPGTNEGSLSMPYPESYGQVKFLQGEILEYLAHIPKQEMSDTGISKAAGLAGVCRHILRSVKNLKDVRHNLEAFRNTANDELYGIFDGMQRRMVSFYGECAPQIGKPEGASPESIAGLVRHNKDQYTHATASLLPLLQSKKISELDSSDLLNVYRELYSSNKAFLMALSDLASGDPVYAIGDMVD